MRDLKKLNNFWLLVFFALSLVYMEFVLVRQNTGNLFSRDSFSMLLFTLSFSAGLYFLATLASGRGIYISGLFLLFFTGTLYSSQLVYFKFFRTYYTLYSAGNAGDVFREFFGTILTVTTKNLGSIILLFIPFFLFLAFGNMAFAFSKTDWKKKALVLCTIAVFHLAGLGTIYSGSHSPNSAYDLYFNSNYPVLSVEKLGLLTTVRLDMIRLAIGWTPELAPTQDPASDAGTDADDDGLPENPAEEAPENPDSGEAHEDPVVKPVTYNSMNIDFDSLLSNTENETLKQMHDYFKNVTPTNKNDYTGRYEGYNLILITAEGFSSLAVNETVTPTLYKMASQGYRFENFYTPIWGVSTSDGEYVATTGLIPKSGVWSYSKSGDNYMPFALGNQLKTLDYLTKAYHDHTYTYYDRDITHPNMGYDYKGIGNGLDVKKTWPESDIEMMEKTMGEYVESQPFHVYYMTVSGHMLYNFTGNYIAHKNRDLVSGLPYTTGPKAYLATQIEFDRAMELLLQTLLEKGIADRTLIAISGDHYPYGLADSEISELLGHKVETNFELYKSTFILYTPGMEPETIEKPMSSLDILPTLSNLMGLEYDSRLLMGRDIFSDAAPLVIFQNRSFITEKGMYNAVTNTFAAFDGQTVDEGYVSSIQSIINNRFYYSSMILDKDYYRVVFGK